MSKGLILDIGNVLVTVKMDRVFDEFWYASICSRREAETFMKNVCKIVHLGLMDLSGAMDTMMRTYVNAMQKQRVISCWCSDKCITKNEKILDYVYDLAENNKARITLASNICFDHMNYIKTIHPLFTNKNVKCIYSCEVGAIKPQQAFYDILLNETFIDDEILYVEDREENISAGIKFSLDTYKFNSLEQKEEEFIERIESFLK